MADKIFAEGMYFEKPHENAPEFVKGKISIKVAQAVPFLEKHENGGGYVNLDLKKSKEGKLYLELNQYIKEKKEEPHPGDKIPF